MRPSITQLLSPACSRRPALILTRSSTGQSGSQPLTITMNRSRSSNATMSISPPMTWPAPGSARMRSPSASEHALGKLHGTATPLHDQVGPAPGVQREKRTLERLGDADQRHDGRDGRRQPGRRSAASGRAAAGGSSQRSSHSASRHGSPGQLQQIDLSVANPNRTLGAGSNFRSVRDDHQRHAPLVVQLIEQVEHARSGP